MADIQDLIQTREELINGLLKTLLRGNGVDLIEALHDGGEDLLDIDEALVDAAQRGEDIQGYLTKGGKTFSDAGSPKLSAYIDTIETSLHAEGWQLSPSKSDRDRVEGLLFPPSPRTPEGSASAMAKTTSNKEKLFARGKLLVEKERPDLSRPFFEKLGDAIGLNRLDNSAWLPQSIEEDLDISMPFEFTDEEKVETFDALLVFARTLLDRKIQNDTTVEQDALRALVGLFGVKALRATKLMGDLK